MRVTRRGQEEEYAGMDTHHLLMPGHATSEHHELRDDDDYELFLAERRAVLARKRPPGFTADWGAQ